MLKFMKQQRLTKDSVCLVGIPSAPGTGKSRLEVVLCTRPSQDAKAGDDANLVWRILNEEPFGKEFVAWMLESVGLGITFNHLTSYQPDIARSEQFETASRMLYTYYTNQGSQQEFADFQALLPSSLKIAPAYNLIVNDIVKLKGLKGRDEWKGFLILTLDECMNLPRFFERGGALSNLALLADVSPHFQCAFSSLSKDLAESLRTASGRPLNLVTLPRLKTRSLVELSDEVITMAVAKLCERDKTNAEAVTQTLQQLVMDTGGVPRYLQYALEAIPMMTNEHFRAFTLPTIPEMAKSDLPDYMDTLLMCTNKMPIVEDDKSRGGYLFLPFLLQAFTGTAVTNEGKVVDQMRMFGLWLSDENLVPKLEAIRITTISRHLNWLSAHPVARELISLAMEALALDGLTKGVVYNASGTTFEHLVAAVWRIRVLAFAAISYSDKPGSSQPVAKKDILEAILSANSIRDFESFTGMASLEQLLPHSINSGKVATLMRRAVKIGSTSVEKYIFAEKFTSEANRVYKPASSNNPGFDLIFSMLDEHDQPFLVLLEAKYSDWDSTTSLGIREVVAKAKLTLTEHKWVKEYLDKGQLLYVIASYRKTTETLTDLNFDAATIEDKNAVKMLTQCTVLMNRMDMTKFLTPTFANRPQFDGGFREYQRVKEEMEKERMMGQAATSTLTSTMALQGSPSLAPSRAKGRRKRSANEA